MEANLLDAEGSDTIVLTEDDLSRVQRSAASREGSKFEIILPGTSTMDLNRRGDIKLDAILEYFVASRSMAFMNPEFCLMDIQEAGYTYFLLQVKYEISRQFYSLARMQQVYFAKKLTAEVHSIGNSTFSLLSTLQDAVGGKELARSYAKLIRVNFQTRKSEPLPGWFGEKYAKYCVVKDDFEMLEDSIPSSKVYTTSYLIRYSDTDQMGHVNHATYVNLCLDAATEASIGGFLEDFRGDICDRLVKTMQVSYVKECTVGETLRVSVWQDEERSDTLRYRVTKEDGKLSMLCSMEFHTTIMRAML